MNTVDEHSLTMASTIQRMTNYPKAPRGKGHVTHVTFLLNRDIMSHFDASRYCAVGWFIRILYHFQYK